MADYNRDQLMQALRAADAAGDSAAATAIATRLQGMQDTGAIPGGESAAEKPGLLSRLAGAMSQAEQADVIPASDAGQAVIGMMPGVGAASAIFGKEPAFANPQSPWPTGIKDVPTVAGNIRQGNYGTAALQTLGVLPDVGYAAAIAKEGAPVARQLGQVAKNPAEAFRSRAPVPVVPLSENEGAIAAGLGENQNRLVTQTPSAAKAEEQMYQQLLDSGWTPQKIKERLDYLGPQATLADLEPFSGLAKASSTTIKGQREAQRTLGSRQRGAEQRLLNTLDVTLAPENYHESLDYLKATRSNEGQPARQTALADAAGKTIKSDMIQRLQKDSPYFNQAMSAGKKIAREEAAREGIEIPASETWYHGADLNDPNLQLMHEPTLRMLDAAKQGYQTLLEPYRDKFTGVINPTPESVELSKTVDALTNEMRTRFPKYGEYLDTWSEPSQQMDALSRGRKILSNDPEITLKMLRNLPENGKEFVQIGLRRALEDKIRDNPQAAVRLFNKGATRDKIRAVFDTPKDFRDLHAQALREAVFQKTANANLSGSRTSELLQGIKQAENHDTSAPKEAVGMAFDVGTGNKIGAARRAANWVYRWAQNKPAPEILDEMSPVMFSRDRALQERMINRFKQRSMPTIERVPTEEP